MSTLLDIFIIVKGGVTAAEAGFIRHLGTVCSESESNPEDPKKAFEYGLSIGMFCISSLCN